SIRLQASQNLVAPPRNQPAGLVSDQPMLRRTQRTCATTNSGEEGFSDACLAVAAKKIASGSQPNQIHHCCSASDPKRTEEFIRASLSADEGASFTWMSCSLSHRPGS